MLLGASGMLMVGLVVGVAACVGFMLLGLLQFVSITTTSLVGFANTSIAGLVRFARQR